MAVAQKKKEKRNVPRGKAIIQASFNNTIVSITDLQGNVLSWSSAGHMSFKGSRKSTPYAAQSRGECSGLTSSCDLSVIALG